MSLSNNAPARGVQDAADITAGVILQIVRNGLSEWFYREPIHADDLRRRVADAIRDHDHDRQTNLFHETRLHDE